MSRSCFSEEILTKTDPIAKGKGLEVIPVIMYHYVRDTQKTKFPGLYSRSLIEFEFQLEHLESSVGIGDVARWQRELDTKAVLTFDDGFSDHYRNVFPKLRRRNISGSFFVSSLPLLKPVVLNVHKIQLLLGSQPGEVLFEELTREIGARSIQKYQESNAVSTDPQRFDENKTVVLKRLLQRDLSEPFRSEILDRLFNKFFSEEESSISRELYMSLIELKEMKAAGMLIGNHTHSHPWLSYLDLSEAKAEITDCESFLLDEKLMDEELRTIAFPYGNSSEEIRSFLSERNYRYCFTTEVSNWDPRSLPFTSIPRLDTNDIPFQ